MKIAHYKETTQELLGWYDIETHGVWNEPTYDEEGNTLQIGFYDDNSIPTPNIEVTNEVWQEALDNGANYVDIENKALLVKEFRTDAEIIKDDKNLKNLSLEDYFNKAVLELSTALPHEMASWGKQESQARAWNADNTVATPFIDELLASRNLLDETKQDLVNKIIGNADAYEVIYGQLLGQYQNLIKQVESATTIAEVEAIVWVENIPPTI